MPRDAFVLKIQRELCLPKYARKVSRLSRNRPQVSKEKKEVEIELPSWWLPVERVLYNDCEDFEGSIPNYKLLALVRSHIVWIYASLKEMLVKKRRCIRVKPEQRQAVLSSTWFHWSNHYHHPSTFKDSRTTTYDRCYDLMAISRYSCICRDKKVCVFIDELIPKIAEESSFPLIAEAVRA